MEGWRRRHTLRRLLQQTPPGQRLLDLRPEAFAALGIEALALDFDGVLAPHGGDCPLPEAEIWLRQAVAVCGAGRVFVLSNRPYGPRVDWFRDQLPGVRFISGVRKKPYGDGLYKTAELASVPLSAILMADDRLLTGCLAAICTGSVPYYVRSPYRDLGRETLHELLFMTLRRLERLFVRVVS